MNETLDSTSAAWSIRSVSTSTISIPSWAHSVGGDTSDFVEYRLEYSHPPDMPCHEPKDCQIRLPIVDKHVRVGEQHR